MRQLIDVYRFVKLVDKGTESLDTNDPSLFKMSGYDIWEPATKSVKENYIKKYRHATTNSVNGICADAQSLGYLHGSTEERDGIAIDIVCLTTEGRRLIGKTMGVPWSLIEEILKAQSQTLTFLFGLLASPALYAVYRIIKLIL
jgi:hypothetical protein